MATELNINDFRNKINDVLGRLINKLPEFGAAEAVNAKTMISQRIILTGKNAKGDQLGTYSERYKKTRLRKHLQVKFVDLHFTAIMWGNIGLQQESLNGDKITVKIGTSNAENEKKLFENTVRYGEILAISQEETEKIGISLVTEISDFLNEEFQK